MNNVDPCSIINHGHKNTTWIYVLVLPPKLYLVDFSSEPARFEQAHLFMIRVQRSARIFLGICSKFFVTHVHTHLGKL